MPARKREARSGKGISEWAALSQGLGGAPRK